MAGRPARGEFDLIDRFFKPLSRAAPGAFALANDGALLQPPDGASLVVTKDLMVAGVHYPEGEEPATVARRLLRVNLSDLAAMGAEAAAYALGLALPRDVDEAWVEAFAAGLARDQAEFGVRAHRRRHGGLRGARGALAHGLRLGGGRRLPHPLGRGRGLRHLRLGHRRRRSAGAPRRAGRPLRARAGRPRGARPAFPPARAPARAGQGSRRDRERRDRRLGRAGRGPRPSCTGVGRRGPHPGGCGAAFRAGQARARRRCGRGSPIWSRAATITSCCSAPRPQAATPSTPSAAASASRSPASERRSAARASSLSMARAGRSRSRARATRTSEFVRRPGPWCAARRAGPRARIGPCTTRESAARATRAGHTAPAAAKYKKIAKRTQFRVAH